MKLIVFIFLFCFFMGGLVQAQTNISADEIEGLFQGEEEAEELPPVEEPRPSPPIKKLKKSLNEIQDLKALETFSDIATIQKRFLPKTRRFEFYASGGTNLNDAFFVGNGLSARLGYNFTEKWGIEGIYSFIQNNNRPITNKLIDKGVTTEGSVTTNGYYGVDIKWTPIYGKYAYFNEKIIPFDLYFSLGFGKTDPKIAESSVQLEGSADLTEALVESPYTVKVGTGQIFALTKWMAFRWDISFHMIQSRTTRFVVATGAVESQRESLNNNLFLNMGLSFFFPGAKYR